MVDLLASCSIANYSKTDSPIYTISIEDTTFILHIRYLLLMKNIKTCIEQIEITVIQEARARGEVGSGFPGSVDCNGYLCWVPEARSRSGSVLWRPFSRSDEYGAGKRKFGSHWVAMPLRQSIHVHSMDPGKK